ncbi:MAG: helix-turn-helix domain-containing protein [Flavobacterium sp.]|uniref:XRE family transcriptional regulator n=1 Tax=Flavobacterium sp. TaxID=239 RepID=UPI00120D0963|nr:LexA family transcriptional regulator [Flavobacterium sp.]RZJ65583.1 MAG: helix-turn-helix domain-containing protein [Flavobacterium sp.]
MSLFSDNIKHLRIKRERSQREVAETLSISRDRYAKYEDGVNSPPPEILVALSRFFYLSIDLLLTVDIRKISVDDLMKLPDNRILLPIKVDNFGENLIEIIPHKAKAGYALGYADPEFIENLQHISLPFLRNGKFRAFPIDGDSMPPHQSGSYVIGRYVEKLGDVLDGKTYILLTKSEGIVYKRLNRNGKNTLLLESDNRFYEPYQIKASDILEIWKFECSLDLNEAEPFDASMENMKDILLGLRNEIASIKSKIN